MGQRRGQHSLDKGAPWPRILAVGGAGYLVSTDGTETETSRSVIYDNSRGRIGHEAMAASHLKMLNGYSAPFTGSEEERMRVETEVARLGIPPAFGEPVVPLVLTTPDGEQTDAAREFAERRKRVDAEIARVRREMGRD